MPAVQDLFLTASNRLFSEVVRATQAAAATRGLAAASHEEAQLLFDDDLDVGGRAPAAARWGACNSHGDGGCRAQLWRDEELAMGWHCFAGGSFELGSFLQAAENAAVACTWCSGMLQQSSMPGHRRALRPRPIPPPMRRAGSTVATARGGGAVTSSASLAAACKERCAKLLCLLGPLHPTNGSQAAQHWLQKAQEPGQARDHPAVLQAVRQVEAAVWGSRQSALSLLCCQMQR